MWMLRSYGKAGDRPQPMIGADVLGGLSELQELTPHRTPLPQFSDLGCHITPHSSLCGPHPSAGPRGPWVTRGLEKMTAHPRSTGPA